MKYRCAIVFALAGVAICSTMSGATAASKSTALKTLRVLATGLNFPEGPSLDPNGKYVYFVDTQDSFVCRFNLKTNTLERHWVTLPGGGKGNGSTIGPDGALYVADVARKSIDRVSLPDGAVTTVVDHDDIGGALLGPNDLIFDKSHALYFTDPNGTWNNPALKASIYRVDPITHAVTKVAGNLNFCNGLIITPDGKTLVTIESPIRQFDAYNVSPAGPLPVQNSPARIIGVLGGGDGIRMGKDGYIYSCFFGDGVVAKFDLQGKIVRRYPAGGMNPTNLCFSRDGKSLYVTETQTNTLVQVPLLP